MTEVGGVAGFIIVILFFIILIAYFWYLYTSLEFLKSNTWNTANNTKSIEKILSETFPPNVGGSGS